MKVDMFADEKYPHIHTIDASDSDNAVDVPDSLIQEFKAAKERYEALEDKIFAIFTAEAERRREAELKAQTTRYVEPIPADEYVQHMVEAAKETGRPY